MPRKKPLTGRQQQVYAYIKARLTAGTIPTVREIATAIGVASPNAVSYHLQALEQKGFIIRSHHSARSIRLTETLRPVQMPFRGEIS